MTRLPSSPCPSCGSRNDDADELTHARLRPAPGTFAVCVYCSVPLVYSDGLTLRWPTDAELDKLWSAYEAWQAIVATAIVRARNRARVG